MDQRNIADLLAKYRAGESSAEEQAALKMGLHQYNMDGESGLSDDDFFAARVNMLLAIDEARFREVSKVRLWQTKLFKIAAAAVILIAFGIGTYFYDAQLFGGDAHLVADVAPGKDGATLTLSSGKKISLADALSGNLADEAGVKISKDQDGQLVYTASSSGEAAGGYNTLTTSRGQQAKIRLADGTLVFLNAESSLRYPVSLASSGSRKVELTGEGYFEVAKLTHSGGKARVPFLVKTASQQVEVLGTHFNISAYLEEPSVRTTLLEGSVRVARSIDALSATSTGDKAAGSVVLVPGEQAVLSGSGVPVVSSVDVATAVAWKDGQFVFADEPLESIMRKVSRWYNVEVVYDHVDQNQRFGGGVSRFENVSKVLKKLELTGGIHFKVEGRRITVSK